MDFRSAPRRGGAIRDQPNDSGPVGGTGGSASAEPQRICGFSRPAASRCQLDRPGGPEAGKARIWSCGTAALGCPRAATAEGGCPTSTDRISRISPDYSCPAAWRVGSRPTVLIPAASPRRAGRRVRQGAESRPGTPPRPPGTSARAARSRTDPHPARPACPATRPPRAAVRGTPPA